ncbi:hypothetical protein [Mycolicibacterium mageritense]|uniref:SRPBCC family protein n=3 Tax=Mycolicibacterium mageritense TaxID=53462 RepID=A0AAI8U1I5_MYCME|nr:hypothetical protein [Mycolicibacterium mageritense]BBX37449.1 hypothetical protein MMAGJ_67310 [Mycolicibacterium mageritense]BDY32271.1 hypothetical protein hbim_06234 [Mycolicibacterium mageritense]CDO25884.1 hypothetical protein BN978_06430 [Mycolicibacterium mageritense DSM 44476 = CIP 104973]
MGKQRPWLAGLMAVIGITALYRGRIRPWMYTWGAADEEVTAVLPGDELVPPGTPRTTRALTIDAPRRTVWAWLAQIGEDRGGFYSYSWLERIVGARIHNANTIHQEWQDLNVGDSVWLARRYGENARQVVAFVQPDSYLVLMAPRDFERMQRGETVSGMWGFYLRRRAGWTRLVVRGSGGAVGHAWFEAAHFVMEVGMMRGLRDRAERTSRYAFAHQLSLAGQERHGQEDLPATPIDSLVNS